MKKLKVREPRAERAPPSKSMLFSVTTDERLVHWKHPRVPIRRAEQHLATARGAWLGSASSSETALPGAACCTGLTTVACVQPSSRRPHLLKLPLTVSSLYTFALSTLPQKSITHVCPHQCSVSQLTVRLTSSLLCVSPDQTLKSGETLVRPSLTSNAMIKILGKICKPGILRHFHSLRFLIPFNSHHHLSHKHTYTLIFSQLKIW